MTTTPITHRLMSLSLAVLVTLGVLGGVDHLAHGPATPDAAATLAATDPLPKTL